MVAGKVKSAMGFQKSPATPKQETPRSFFSPGSQKVGGGSQNKSGGAPSSRSFGVYFPRSSAQVQPRPPDVAELVRLVEDLREKESRLRTELLEHKILKETVAIVPFLEKEIAAKNEELELSRQRVQDLEEENHSLRFELESLRSEISDAEEMRETEMENKIKDMETEIEEMRKLVSEQQRRADEKHRSLCNGARDSEDCFPSQRFQGLTDMSSSSNNLKNPRKCQKSPDTAWSLETPRPVEPSDLKGEDVETDRAHQEPSELAIPAVPRSRAPRVPKPPPTRCTTSVSSSSSSSCSSSASSHPVVVSSTTERKTNPPPPPACPAPAVPPPPPTALESTRGTGTARPPPPPPPPPSRGAKGGAAKVRRVPEVVEFYHSLMRRDSKREGSGGVPEAPTAASTKSMIGEIENRSAHLLAIKSEVETQGDFIRFLIREVENSAFTNIEDVVAFVKWLDDELCFLVDERAVLKHFDWPERKADAMREAAFGYCDLKKLDSEASSFRDDLRQPCASSLKKLQALFEKLEHGVYNLSRVREAAIKRYKAFQIPWEWMQDTGYITQIKLASVTLAMKYMKRISVELETVGGTPEEEELMLQGVRFAFRVHQFAGGFDMETMRAFQEFKDKARSCLLKENQSHHQQSQRPVCRTTSR
ncbi:hypothetical protein Taro_009591 [Colocasia esculenta]|uniref:Protein CHUP1, chloroplastic n=1 Tax=Colocasia esculenta TaxID=4460 RepID=A0A843U5A9_COLES|nr:hypothetical protein [Colocasia esculenta]